MASTNPWPGLLLAAGLVWWLGPQVLLAMGAVWLLLLLHEGRPW
jgi:hypothetical protein